MEKLINIYKKNEEILNYLIFGVLTTIISIASYAIFTNIFNIDILISNILSWILSVLFAYITNRWYVFESKNNNFFYEMISFFSARLVTGLIDIILMWVLVDNNILDDFIAKIIVNVIVIILNYIFSKLFVFKGGK